MDSKQWLGRRGLLCVHHGGHKTLNLRVSPSFTKFLSITSESFSVSEQSSSTAGMLSPMQSLGRKKNGYNPSSEHTSHLGSHAHSIPILTVPRGCCPDPFSPPAKLTRQIVSLPCSQASGEKAGACCRFNLSDTDAAHPFHLPLSLLPRTPFSHTHPPTSMCHSGTAQGTSGSHRDGY